MPSKILAGRASGPFPPSTRAAPRWSCWRGPPTCNGVPQSAIGMVPRQSSCQLLSCARALARCGCGAGIPATMESERRSPAPPRCGRPRSARRGVRRATRCRPARSGPARRRRRGWPPPGPATVAGSRLPEPPGRRPPACRRAACRRAGQGLQLGQPADAQRALVDHAGKPGHLRDAELGGIMAAEAPAEMDHRHPQTLGECGWIDRDPRRGLVRCPRSPRSEGSSPASVWSQDDAERR